jgi:hypothetical protein
MPYFGIFNISGGRIKPKATTTIKSRSSDFKKFISSVLFFKLFGVLTLIPSSDADLSTGDTVNFFFYYSRRAVWYKPILSLLCLTFPIPQYGTEIPTLFPESP